MKSYSLKQSATFKKWFKKITKRDQLRILARLQRITEDGNFGDHKWFGDIGELRFFFGAGYRIYYALRGQTLVFLLCGGDKSSQDDDIRKARAMLPSTLNQED